MGESCEVFVAMRTRGGVKPSNPAITERKKDLAPLFLESSRRICIEQVAADYGERGIIVCSALVQEALMSYHGDEPFSLPDKSLATKTNPEVRAIPSPKSL